MLFYPRSGTTETVLISAPADKLRGQKRRDTHIHWVFGIRLSNGLISKAKITVSRSIRLDYEVFIPQRQLGIYYPCICESGLVVRSGKAGIRSRQLP